MEDHKKMEFRHSETQIYFKSDFEHLITLAPTENSFVITDEQIFFHYQEDLKPWKCIVIPVGESSKNWEVANHIIRQLLVLEADRSALIIGFGGGVVTDIAGFVAAIYKRGVRCAFVPTSILGMVDASIGGKNGLDMGEYKNIIGVIRQPEFVAYNTSLLKTLDKKEWINGFAEIIKHACILDAELFAFLKRNNLQIFRKEQQLLDKLIRNNVLIKAEMVIEDEMESGPRKLLNFGHTFGHAIENKYLLPHGHAVSIGMAFAAKLSEKELGFSYTNELTELLKQYELPVDMEYNPEFVFQNLIQDKKRIDKDIDYVLLKEIGKSVIHPISIVYLKKFLNSDAHL